MTVIKGGLVRVPPAPPSGARQNADIGVRDFLLEGLPIEPEHLFACITETILMGQPGSPATKVKGKFARSECWKCWSWRSCTASSWESLRPAEAFGDTPQSSFFNRILPE
ncbi:hypothetical protein CAI21_16500 [Alkalilimnicola ehrlichii]|uniref:Uncharacterized protein n=1 Tax=Alkalilimnicola ehrlichii TaxID=351052 RepID=A0A3E0WL99_9GAMM|nr:hypothetical protein CAI21_16500 [Alkalilimnicola ehrlichii]RFA32931.1 hypothetical protein CAL65_18495 [Alkalilimnicola ehrlichii]